jgi:hypothetical protein
MYALALYSDEKRCLVNISINSVSFNISGWREFNTPEEAEEFKERWKNHPYAKTIASLTVVPVPKK